MKTVDKPNAVALTCVIDRLVREHGELLRALKMIAGEVPCADNLMSDKEIARVVLAKVKDKP